jgi:N-dimethylarginine dimethylaminohydrolase
MKAKALSAYQGRGWTGRSLSSREELRSGIWSPLRTDSEYLPLKAVLLYQPGAELDAIRDPNSVQHLKKINSKRLSRELKAIASTFERLGVSVHWMDRAAFPERFFNLMYVRDSFWMTPEGAVIGRMASRVRAGEEKFAARALAELGIPVIRTISGAGLFEGADALWVDATTVLCSSGSGRGASRSRTNKQGFNQLKSTLKEQGVRCIGLEVPRGIQHLLGVLQIVDRRTALLRNEIVCSEFRRKLLELGFRIIDVPEWDEITSMQAMNIVTVSPRTVVMPKGRPKFRALLEKNRIRVAAEVSIEELLKGAGGLACATGIVGRKLSPG